MGLQVRRANIIGIYPASGISTASLRLLRRRLKAPQRAQHVRPERRLHQEAVGVKVARDAPLQAGVLAARACLSLCNAARASSLVASMHATKREEHRVGVIAMLIVPPICPARHASTATAWVCRMRPACVTTCRAEEA